MRLRVWGQILIIALLFSSFFLANPRPAAADEGVLQWMRLNTPQNGAAGEYVIASNSEVNRIAIGADGKTIYALDSQNSRLYKSGDGGYAWLDLSAYVGGGAAWTNLAVSADDANIVAVVTDGGTNVWASLDGGNNFFSTNVPALGAAETITCIMISPGYGGLSGVARDIAIGTADALAGSGIGRIFIMALGSFPLAWTDVSTGAAGWIKPLIAAVDVFAVAYPAGYGADKVMLAIVADVAAGSGDTYLYAGQRDATGVVTWNIWTDYPVEIAKSGEDSPPSPLTYASLALPSDYFGGDAAARRVYASWSDGVGGNANDDVYRLDDTTVVRLDAGSGIEFVCSSLAYWGTCDEGKLLAGRRASAWSAPMASSVQVRSTFEPQVRFPTWRNSRKPPTGVNEAQVTWSADGKVTYCGTSTIGGAANDESAVSWSSDDGLSWNQVGLIDTVITRVNDIEPAPQGDVLFMTTVNAGVAKADSLWRAKGSLPCRNWERVLARSSLGAGDNPLIRVDPDYASTETLWCVNADSTITSQELFLSKDGGDTYLPRGCNIVLVDLAAEDENAIYGLDVSGFVSRSADGGWTWEMPVDTQLGSGYSIACARATTTPDNFKGNILVGGRGTGTYDVAYSTDGAASFTPITELLPLRDNTLVAASSGYKSDGSILAINSGGMYCWGIFSGKTEWEQWWWGSVSGLALSRNYGFYFPTPASLWAPATVQVRWCAASAGLDAGITFGPQPSRGELRLSGGLMANEPVTAWIIDRRPYGPPAGGVWCYVDTLSWLGPAPVTPASRALVDYDPVSGRAGAVSFTWKPRSLSKGYQIQVAADRDFTISLVDVGGGWAGPFYNPSASAEPALVLPPGGGTVIDGSGNSWPVPALTAGRTYYWRVKIRDVATGDAISSAWSWTEDFTVEAGVPVRASSPGLLIMSPRNGAAGVTCQPAFSWSTMHGAAEYEFVLAEDAAMTDVVMQTGVSASAYKHDGRLEWGKTYFWRARVTEPTPGDWSSVAIFTVMEEPSPAGVGAAGELPSTPIWAWAIIAMGAVSILVVFVLILRM